MRISDWSSDVCSSDLRACGLRPFGRAHQNPRPGPKGSARPTGRRALLARKPRPRMRPPTSEADKQTIAAKRRWWAGEELNLRPHAYQARSEEHTSELQSLMRISYAVFCLKKKIIEGIRVIVNSSLIAQSKPRAFQERNQYTLCT